MTSSAVRPAWSLLLAGFVLSDAHDVQALTFSNPAPIAIEAFRLVTIKLENVGPFKTLSLALDQNWNVLLGNNGSGKSMLLRAIALVLCGDDSRALLEGSRLLRTGATRGAVELMVGRDVYRTELRRDKSGAVYVNVGTRVSPLKTGRWVALAFPPLRGISIDNPKGPTADGSPSPVVEDVLPILTGQTDGRLSSLKQWLVNLDVRSTAGDGVSAEDAAGNRRLRDHFFDVFNAFVPGANVKFASVDRKSWLLNVTTDGVEVGIDRVSQGTSSILGWVGALLQRMYEIHGAGKDIQRQAAVVLIDEIDAHLLGGPKGRARRGEQGAGRNGWQNRAAPKEGTMRSLIGLVLGVAAVVGASTAGAGLTDLGGAFAYHPDFRGGVHVAECGTDGVGQNWIVFGPGPGGGPHVIAVWATATQSGSVDWFAYHPSFTGGVHVACIASTGNGVFVTTGAGPGGGPHVRFWFITP